METPTNGEVYKETGKFISVFIWGEKKAFESIILVCGINLANNLLANSHFPFNHFLRVDSNVVTAKGNCFCHFEVKCAAGQRQVLTRVIFVVITSCTGALCVYNCTSSFCIFQVFQVSFSEDYKVAELNSSNQKC